MVSEIIKLYEDREDVTLTTYIIKSSQQTLNGQSRPAILICPGGAYLSCSDREAEPVALRFAAMGYHAFVLRYSVYFGNEVILPEPGVKYEQRDHSIHPNPMRDIAKAMLMIRKNADQWHVDPEKTALCGFSAGAHNCAMYSVYWHTPLIYAHFNIASDVFKPAAVILGYMLSDYYLLRDQEKSEDQKELFDLSNLALAGVQVLDDETLDELSPALHVSDKTPPMFLWATAKDELVPVEHTTRMANALANCNIPFEAHIFENGKHGLSLSDQSSAYDLTQIDTDAAKWLSLAESWLLKRFALDLNPSFTPGR
jgi:acetyl esterase/lipase